MATTVVYDFGQQIFATAGERLDCVVGGVEVALTGSGGGEMSGERWVKASGGVWWWIAG